MCDCICIASNQQLESSVNELTGINDSMIEELGQFAELRDNMREYATSQNSNLRNVLNETNSVYNRIHGLLLENERVLLQRIAQDTEFLIDRSEGMTKMEFERFISRLPQRLKPFFQRLHKNRFSQLAKTPRIDRGALLL